jgi:hypothetical protein
MAMNFVDLNPIIRLLMVEELKLTISSNKLYQGKRLTPLGLQEWSNGLLSAIEAGNDVTLTNWLEQSGRLKTTEESTTNGVTRTKKVPYNAAQTLAEGEFNRFYIRAVCRQALNMKTGVVTAYRARYSENPRPESIAIDGRQYDAQALLNDLRENTTTDAINTALGMPPGVNSGMSVRL